MKDNYDLIFDAEGLGNKKLYDPRSYLKAAEVAMKERVIQALKELRSKGKTLLG